MRRKTSKITFEINKEQLVEKELLDKVTLWMLRIIVKLGGYKTLIENRNNFSNDDIAYFLDLAEFEKEENFDKNKILNFLTLNLEKFENRKRFSNLKILTKNINQISTLMKLTNHEKSVLEFYIIMSQYNILEETVDILGNNLNTIQIKRILSVILDIPKNAIDEMFSINSKFSKSSILTIDVEPNYFSRKMDIVSTRFSDNMLCLNENIEQIIKSSISICSKANLRLSDYTHVEKDLNILIPYLKNSVNKKDKGINVLLYGLPGTGKTELTKTIANFLNCKLFEISYSDQNDEPIDSNERMKSYKTACALLNNKKTLLLYDEAEDIFDSSDSFFSPKKQKDKLWINKILENNAIPTIWITNDINSVDDAIIRRFDMTFELPIPTKEKRLEIIKKYSSNLLDKKTILKLSQNETIAPALISRAAKVVGAIECENNSEAFQRVINNTLVAQGYYGINQIKEKDSSLLPNCYNPEYINTSTNLKELTLGIKSTQNARICLYGPAGTGKSAFGRYVAERIGKPMILKKSSDLMSKWVGETERNIAKAFKEAKEEKAVLVFDEIDSFLGSREDASSNWEVTQVNEMLVQMENYDGIFIATTNLMANLDKASLRRFDLKLEFGYLQSEQAIKLFKSHCKELKLRISKRYLSDIENLRYLTPGDFAAVIRQNKFQPIKNIKDFICRLENEVEIKNISNTNQMGFL